MDQETALHFLRLFSWHAGAATHEDTAVDPAKPRQERGMTPCQRTSKEKISIKFIPNELDAEIATKAVTKMKHAVRLFPTK